MERLNPAYIHLGCMPLIAGSYERFLFGLGVASREVSPPVGLHSGCRGCCARCWKPVPLSLSEH